MSARRGRGRDLPCGGMAADPESFARPKGGPEVTAA